MGTAVENRISSSNLEVLNPSEAKTTEKPITTKIKNVASDSLKNEKKEDTVKDYFARIWNQFSACVKKVLACVCKFFCFYCIDDESSSDYASDDISDKISMSDPLGEVEDFFMEIYKGKIPADVDCKLADLGLKKAKDPQNPANDIQFREQRLKQLQATAQEMGSHLSSKPTPSSFVLKPQTNLGNTCYMNSVLQCLETCYEEEYLPLISKDIALQKGETLEGLENRLLKEWAPIPEMSEDEKTKFSLKLLDKKKEYNELKEKSSQNLNYCRNEILFLQMNLRNREDRILFKWSYLLLLQAKLKGTSGDIYNALQLHHKACFELALHAEFKARPYEQKDAAAYQEYWNDMMGVALCPVAMQRVSEFEKKPVYTSIQVAPEPLLQIEIKKSDKLIELIENKFLEILTPEDNEQCTFELPDKREVKLDTYNVVSRISSAPPKHLTFQFKRFLCKIENGQVVRRKLNDPLPIDLNQDLKPLDFSSIFRTSLLSGIKPLYELTGFVVHVWGTIDSGHYVSYVKREGKWYCCNDEKKPKLVEGSAIPLENAYMMFFKLHKSG